MKSNNNKFKIMFNLVQVNFRGKMCKSGTFPDILMYADIAPVFKRPVL